MKVLLFIPLLAWLLAVEGQVAGAPALLTYQGRVMANGVNFTGSGQFKFALVNEAGDRTYWSNDNTSVGGNAPTNAVVLAVDKGYYTVLIGDTSVAHMNALTPEACAPADVRLRVWFNDGVNGFERLLPDHRISAVGYSLIAETVRDGSITGASIAPSAITGVNIADNTISSTQIAHSPVGGISSFNLAGAIRELDAKKMACPEIQVGDFNAIVGKLYVVTGPAVIEDPLDVLAGHSYCIYNMSGEVTIKGVRYSKLGEFIVRTFDGSNWMSLPTASNVEKTSSLSGRVVLLGDSITTMNTGPGSRYPSHASAQGYFTWANIALRGRLTLVRNLGVDGLKTDGMLDKVPEVLLYPCDTVIVMGGTNDCLHGRSFFEITDSLRKIYIKLRSSGKLVIACTIPPAEIFNLEARRTAMRVNQWIKENCRLESGIVLADTGGALVDTEINSADNAWKPRLGLTMDGVHPSVNGAIAMGSVLAKSLDSHIPWSDFLPTGNYDYTNLIELSALNGIAPNGPAGMSSFQSAETVWSYPARKDEVSGRWAQVHTRGYARLRVAQLSASDYIGKKFYAACEYEAEINGALENLSISVYADDLFVTGCPFYTSTIPHHPPTKGILLTHAFVVPQSSKTVSVYITVIPSNGSEVTVRLSRPLLRLGEVGAVN
jgi:lysophospholipase L1-like esterase